MAGGLGRARAGTGRSLDHVGRLKANRIPRATTLRGSDSRAEADRSIRLIRETQRERNKRAQTQISMLLALAADPDLHALASWLDAHPNVTGRAVVALDSTPTGVCCCSVPASVSSGQPPRPPTSGGPDAVARCDRRRRALPSTGTILRLRSARHATSGLTSSETD